MANIKTELSEHDTVKITFAGRQGRHLRLTDSWTDWMLNMDDFRDLVNPLTEDLVESLITKLLNKSNKLQFVNTRIGQEHTLTNGKKIVRRLVRGIYRKQYQSVALFIRNDARQWPPEPVYLHAGEILSLVRAMMTLDCPSDHCVRDSLRNMQYLLSILWVKKVNPKLLQGIRRPKANEIFRISLVK